MPRPCARRPVARLVTATSQGYDVSGIVAPGDDGTNTLDRSALHIVKQMGIPGGGDWRAVAQQGTDQRQGEARRSQHAGEAVAQIMQPKVGNSGGRTQGYPSTIDV